MLKLALLGHESRSVFVYSFETISKPKKQELDGNTY